MGLGRGWMKHCAIHLAWITLSAICASSGSGQSQVDGAIAGHILSATGEPVANAHIVAREIDTGLLTGARTGKRGEFFISRLPVGEYEITIEQSHTGVTLSDSVAVGLGQVLTCPRFLIH
jgi:hypothetical protein